MASSRCGLAHRTTGSGTATRRALACRALGKRYAGDRRARSCCTRRCARPLDMTCSHDQAAGKSGTSPPGTRLSDGRYPHTGSTRRGSYVAVQRPGWWDLWRWWSSSAAPPDEGAEEPAAPCQNQSPPHPRRRRRRRPRLRPRRELPLQRQPLPLRRYLARYRCHHRC